MLFEVTPHLLSGKSEKSVNILGMSTLGQSKI